AIAQAAAPPLRPHPTAPALREDQEERSAEPPRPPTAHGGGSGDAYERGNGDEDQYGNQGEDQYGNQDEPSAVPGAPERAPEPAPDTPPAPPAAQAAPRPRHGTAD
ncbi:hypothetical protein GTY86_21025, partial [Streptomyces sp. SID5770]|nr:hypothetical protein [Streptomyces sp. SID5770]